VLTPSTNNYTTNTQIKFNIHKGICWYYQSLLESGLMNAFGDLTSKFPDYQVVATGAHLFAVTNNNASLSYTTATAGHSLGGALASIFAFHAASAEPTGGQTKVYTFGSPRCA
jgi:hypothetical protein